MGSGGFLIIFAAANLAAAKLAADDRLARALSLLGALVCAASLVGLTFFAVSHAPRQLAVLGGLITAAAGAETVVRVRGRPANRTNRRNATRADQTDRS